MVFSAEAERVGKIITKSQICRLASRHGLGIEAVEDMLQDVVLKLLDGSSTFDPAKGKFEHWLRTTISLECVRAGCGRTVSTEEFGGEDGDGEFLSDSVDFENFAAAANSDEFDLNEICAANEIDDPFWHVAMTREGWAEHHDLTLDGGDNMVDRLVADVKKMKAQGLGTSEILALLNFGNPACRRQRRPKQSRASAKLAAAQKQIELF